MKANYKLVRRSKLFSSSEKKQFPWALYYRQIGRPIKSDVDVIIGSYGQIHFVNEIIKNYRKLETKLKLHFIVIETSPKIENFKCLDREKDITGIWLPYEYSATKYSARNPLGPSNALSLTFELGALIGKSKHIFCSHSDMMGCKQNFITWLKDKLSSEVLLASFSQRHLYPFPSGMILKRETWESFERDSLPKKMNDYHFHKSLKCPLFVKYSNWLDIGESYANEVLKAQKRIFISASYGVTGKPMGHPLFDVFELNEKDQSFFPSLIEYQECVVNMPLIEDKYPELLSNEYSMWRKSFSESGDLLFLHAGRGVLTKDNGKRMDFLGYLKEFNQRIDV